MDEKPGQGREGGSADADVGASADTGGSGGSPRLACPSCGSVRTQPFLHAGPAARVNMQCRDCGHLFKDKHLRR